jgi:hypothetical protein
MSNFNSILKQLCEDINYEEGTKVYINPKYLNVGDKKSGTIETVSKQNYIINGKSYSKSDVSSKPYKK